MARWNNWPDYIPFSYNPQENLRLITEWYAQYTPLLEEYASLAMAALRNSGFTLAVETSPQTTYFNTPTGWSYGGWAEKDGFRTAWSIGPMTPRDYLPEEWASQIAQNWQFELLTTVRFNPSSEQITNSVLANTTVDTIDTAWKTGPGPSVTVQTNTTLQPNQTPSSPDTGTLVSDPGEVTTPEETHTFDEWNWFWRQQTGRIPPAPEDAGFPLSRRNERITKAEWQSYIDAWLNGQTGGTDGGTGGTGGAGGTGGTNSEIFSLFGLLLAFLMGR
jgi:hypothetical protein